MQLSLPLHFVDLVVPALQQVAIFTCSASKNKGLNTVGKQQQPLDMRKGQTIELCEGRAAICWLPYFRTADTHTKYFSRLLMGSARSADGTGDSVL